MYKPCNYTVTGRYHYNLWVVTTPLFLCSPDEKFIIFAMQDGSIRINRLNPDDWRDFSDHWQLSMHDNSNGTISKMCFSHDNQYFFTCGHDGNVFSYKFYPEDEIEPPEPPTLQPLNVLLKPVEDLDGYSRLSLEEAIVKAELDRQMKVGSHI